MPEKTNQSDLDKFLEPTKHEIGGAQIGLLALRVRSMYKLLKCENEKYAKEILASGNYLYHPLQEPITKPRF